MSAAVNATKKLVASSLESDELSKEVQRLRDVRRTYDPDDPRLILVGEDERSVLADYRKLEGKRHALVDELSGWQYGYTRPSWGFAGLLSRGLQAPTAYVPINYQLHRLPIAERRYRLAGAALGFGSTGLLVALVIWVPWLSISPMAYLTLWATQLFGGTGTVVAAVLAYACIVTLSPGVFVEFRRKGSGSYRARSAMHSEQWFRMGSERWTTGQRLVSCVLSGTVHMMGFVYPLGSIIVGALLGVVFMMAYQRAYRESQDTKSATLASAKLHTAYLAYAPLYLVVAMICTIVAASM